MKKIYMMLLLATMMMSSFVIAQPNQRADVMCPMVYLPVCGADGIIYSNRCFAEKDDIRVVGMENCENGENVVIDLPKQAQENKPQIPIDIIANDDDERRLVENKLENSKLNELNISNVKAMSQNENVVVRAETNAKLFGFINMKRDVNLVVDENSAISRVPNFWDFMFRYERTMRDMNKVE